LLNLIKFYRPVLFVVLKLGIASSACKYAVLFWRRFIARAANFALFAACGFYLADVKFCVTDFFYRD